MEQTTPQETKQPDERACVPEEESPGPAYGWYALGVLVLVYALNFIDRQMLTILAVDIKRDLHISDAQFGFLYGTAFGVFYALFGIPLGKLADRWPRTRLLAIGLATWSTMTAASGLACNFTQLGFARIGVGVGEATAGPCGYSLLADYFPPRRRATAVAIYSAGIYLGGGLALSIGAGLAHAWDHAFVLGARPLGLAGWQAAFLGLGLPGLGMSLWVSSLKEPRRGRHEVGHRIMEMSGRDALRAFGRDVATIAPPFTVFMAARRGVKALVVNLLLLAVCALAAWGLTEWLGDMPQWIVLGIGVYAVVSWTQSLRHDDPEAYGAIWQNPAVVGINIGYGLTCALTYAATAFGPLYAMEVLHAPANEVALIVGGGGAAGGALGVIAGGALGDRLSGGVYHSRRLVVVLGALSLAMIAYGFLMATGSAHVFYWIVFPLWFLLSGALGSAAGTIVNIVPARVRATATASFFLGATLLGLALGPYVTGRLSGAWHSLWVGLTGILVVMPFSFASLVIAWRHLVRQERAKGL
ncbi:MFS transporter [Novosphingobium nitrogenifigens]|uniref:MFS transporter n=1 Tax=Novosphingobium nitrogenifigens TaxID=378548 RepID=UPI0012F512CB|nr:MFS transporter [Novosphingobium nitrogenifigens]